MLYLFPNAFMFVYFQSFAVQVMMCMSRAGAGESEFLWSVVHACRTGLVPRVAKVHTKQGKPVSASAARIKGVTQSASMSHRHFLNRPRPRAVSGTTRATTGRAAACIRGRGSAPAPGTQAGARAASTGTSSNILTHGQRQHRQRQQRRKRTPKSAAFRLGTRRRATANASQKRPQATCTPCPE